jgi:hypothetical protein
MEPLRSNGVRHRERIVGKEVERHGHSGLRESGLAVPAHIEADNPEAIDEQG